MVKKRKKNKKKSPLILLLIVIVVVIWAIMNIIENNKKADVNSLIGEFLYADDGTIYEFKSNKKGSMKCGNMTYKFSYKVSNDELAIDYVKDSVKDVKYKYKLKDGLLTLVSTEGTITIGEEYNLIKKVK